MKRIFNITLCLLLLSFVLMISFTSCEKHKHTFGEWATALEPTCIAEGRLERSCECGEKQTQGIPTIEHEKGEWVITLAPTCTEEGKQERACACGENETQTLAALDHKPSEWHTDVAATIFNKGSKCTYCTRCSTILQTEEIPRVVSHGFTYKVNEDGKTCTVTGIIAHSSQQIGVPAEIDGYKVTEIGDEAFRDINILEIYIPEGVTHIGKFAFVNIGSLRISFPDSLITVEPDAFDGSNSKQIFEYEGARYLKNESNSYMLLLEVLDSDNVKSINIHEDTRIICNGAFSSCDNLEKVNILGDSLIVIGQSAFAYCHELTEINIPNSLKRIEMDAFRFCEKLTEINIPDGIEFLSASAFMQCYSLKCNEYENMLYIGPERNPYLILLKPKSEMISSCKIHEDTEDIAGGVFIGLEYLKTIIIPENLAALTEYVKFASCPVLDNVVIPKGTTYICSDKFVMCTFLKEISLPEGIKEIGSMAFYSCRNLETITFLDGLEIIGNDAFLSCLKLKSIYLPDTLSNINAGAFDECVSLTDIYFDGTKEQWKNIQKGENWDRDTGKYTVHCTDGDIKKQ